MNTVAPPGPRDPPGVFDKPLEQYYDYIVGKYILYRVKYDNPAIRHFKTVLFDNIYGQDG